MRKEQKAKQSSNTIPSEINYDNLLESITKYYLDSRDFNGLPARDIMTEFNIDADGLKELIVPFVKSDQITVVSGGNPHIKAFSEQTYEEQIDFLGQPESICLYPSKKYLETALDHGKYENRPYEKELALGYG